MLTVRLSESDQKLTRDLRARGVAVADLVRNALRQEHQRHHKKPRTAKDVKKFLADLHAKYPVPLDTASLGVGVDTTDPNSVRAYIVARLKRKKLR